ncbi:MAG TPA: hypothetical protein PLO23_05235, partial [Alphaproteobacteria bacterium]|nr:hypothetical protein [Alphaproteobacteria bacterium]
MAAEKNTPQTAQTTAKAGANDSRSQEVLSNSLEAQGAVGATALKVGQPGENIAEVVGVESGKTYVLDFTQASIINAAIKGGDLVVEFANGASVVLKGYKAASDVTLQMADGRAVTAEQLINLSTAQTDQPSQEQLTEPAPANENAPQEQVNLLEQQLETTEKPVMNGVEQLTEAEQVSLENLPPEVAEALAEQLAEIDPAAGDAQGPGNSPQNSGLGFGSSFESQGVIGLADVGPIDPTALRYQLPEFEEKLFINEDIDPIQPTLDPKDPETEQSLEGAYKVYEDGSIQLLLEALPDMEDSILTITIKGIPSTWTVTGEGTYDPLTQTWTITTGIGESFFGGPIVKPPADSDIDLQDLIFTVVEFNPGTGQTGTATEIVDIIVDAVADTPEVEAPDNTGLEGAHLDVSITGQAGDTDGSEVIVKYQITGLPEGFTFNKGSLVSPGVWELAPGDIVGLKAIPPNDDYYGSINLNVTVFTTESPISDLDFDNTNDDAQATDPFTLTWLPVCDPPEVFIDLPKDPDTGVKNALVYEDNSIGVRVVGTLAPGGTPNEVLTLKVTGIDLTKLDNLVLEGEAGANWVRVPGSPDNAAAYTITLPAGTNYDGIFTFTPKAQSDLDLTGMKVTGTSYEPATDTTSSANEDSFNVLVDAVADKPSIVADDATGDEGAPIALNIAGQLGVDNFDSSESITGYLIKGPLTGFTFTDALGNAVGTKVSDTEWSFTPAQIAGLKIVPPTADFNGVLNLTATVLTKDTATDIDFDTTNNTNSAEDPFKITWDQDDQPIVGQAVETVDESFLEITETGNVNVNYGVDGPGKVTVNGEFTSGGSLLGNALTSGGVPVTIALAAVPGYALYEGFAGTTKVFSLKVFENGSYEYKQFVALDHADGNNPNDIIVLNFGITATDADGDATKGTIVINVKDDAPTAVN